MGLPTGGTRVDHATQRDLNALKPPKKLRISLCLGVAHHSRTSNGAMRSPLGTTRGFLRGLNIGNCVGGLLPGLLRIIMHFARRDVLTHLFTKSQGDA